MGYGPDVHMDPVGAGAVPGQGFLLISEQYIVFMCLRCLRIGSRFCYAWAEAHGEGIAVGDVRIEKILTFSHWYLVRYIGRRGIAGEERAMCC